GHTDSLGITAEKVLLSKSRSSVVKSFLIRQGINARRMVSEGRGDSQPRATNSTAGGRRVNNRIELRAL
ncbi:MAG: OmpA family protein, partial [Cocleimonas sp.]